MPGAGIEPAWPCDRRFLSLEFGCSGGSADGGNALFVNDLPNADIRRDSGGFIDGPVSGPVKRPGKEHWSHNRRVSDVANLLIAVRAPDAEQVEALSRWLEEEATRAFPPYARGGVGSLQRFTDPSGHKWGGPKNPEAHVWAGVLNHADLHALIEQIRGLPWRFASDVQVLLQAQDDSYFRLFMFRGGVLQSFEPPPEGDAELVPWEKLGPDPSV